MKNTRRFAVENSYGMEIYTAKKQIKSAEEICRTGLHRRFVQILCLLLMTSFLANSTPAAPKAITASASEIGRDVRFAYLSNNYAAALGGWANSFFLLIAPKRQTQAISRIEILPGDGTVIRQEEPVNFTAIAYSAEGNPISGLKFKWTVKDAGRNLNPHNLANGIFAAKNRGSFLITAEAENFQAQVNVTVKENPPLLVMKKIKDDIAKGKTDYIKKLKDQNKFKSEEIDSKKDYKDKKNDAAESAADEQSAVKKAVESNDGESKVKSESPVAASKSDPPMMRPIDEDGWNDNNWWRADDPGNGVGNPPGTSPDAGAGNGNFQFSAPVIALPGRGIDLNLSLNYNSRVWSKSASQMIFDAERGFPAPGWSFGFGKIMFMGTGGGCMMIDADGTNHGYTGPIYNYNSGNYSSTSFNGHTTDGTFIDYSCSVSTYNGATSMSASATLPNGTRIFYYTNSANGRQAYPSQIIDAQGNYINISYLNNRGPEISTVTDTMGRVINFNYDSSSPSRLISVTAPRLDNTGTRTVVRLHYKQIALNAGFAYPNTTDTNNNYPSVVDAIYYPGTGTGYWFNDGDSYSSYGMIAKVIEQRGMSWSGAAGDQGTVTAGTMSKQAIYNYPLSPDYTLNDAPTYTTLTESWAGMDTAAAVTSYDLHMNSNPRTITVTQPNGVKSKQTSYNASGQWYDGLIYQDETLDSANNQLSKSVVDWEKGSYDAPRPKETKVTDEKGQILKTTYTYDPTYYNQLISQKQYDYDGTTLLKEARNSYENSSSYTGRHIFNLVKTNEIYDGAGVRVARTDYEYDNNAVVNGTQNHNLKATPGVTMHLAAADPYTAETVDGPCLSGQFNYSECSYDGEIITTAGGYYAVCNYECFEHERISAYDPNTIFRGNVTKVTGYADAAALTGAISQTKQYDDTGNLVAESASCCELKTYDYTISTQYAYPTTQTRGSSDPNSPIRNTGTAVYDFNTGLVKQTTDPNGRTDTTVYNADTLRPTTSTSSTGAYSQTVYDESAMTITDEVHEYGGTLAGKSVKYLNGIGQVVKETALGANSIYDIVETKYDNLGRVWKQSRPYRAGNTLQWTETTYDLLGRTKTVTEPDGSVSKAFYNEANTTKPSSATSALGSTIRVVDAWGRERWGRYDALERLAEVVEPSPDAANSPNGMVSGAGNLSTQYIYNTLGNLTETVQGIQHRKFKYDSLGRLTRQKLAEQTATLNDAGNYVGAGNSAFWSDSYIYDERSNVTQKTDARGVKTSYVYADTTTGASDPLNRLRLLYYDLSGAHDTSISINSAFNVIYDYETSGDQDRIKKIESTGLAKEEYTYDTEGRVSDYKQTVWYRESYPMTVSYLYDTLSRVKEVHYPAQYGLAGSPRKVVQQTYDVASRLSTLTYNGNRQAGDVVYNAADQTTSINIGAAGTNQVNENYTFDAQTGLLTNQKVQRGAATLLDLSYEYNRNNSVGNTTGGKTGHLTKILDNLNQNKDRSYEYDALGRLTKAKGGATNIWQQSYGYDRYGNRTSVTASGVAADNSAIPSDGYANLSYDTNSNRITSSGFQYDVAGNQIRAQDASGAWIKMDYDYAGRLSVVKKDDGTGIQAFQYAPSGARLMNTDYSTYLTTFYANLGGTTLAEYVEFSYAVPTWTKSYTYLGDGLLSTISNSSGVESIEFNHPDRLGTRTITNQQTGSSSEQATLPFGTALNAETSVSLTTNKKRFTSYDRSGQTGLDYAVNRTYDSKQGRFTSVDPIGMAAASATNPQTLNLYTYCGNDPINHTDPSGLFWGGLFRAIGKIFGVVNKILKWVAVAIIVAAVVIAVVASPAVAAAFLQTVAGVIGNILGISVNASPIIVNFTTGAVTGGGLGVSIGVSGQIIAGAYAVGAIANRFAGDEEVIKISTRCPKVGTTPLCPGHGVGQPGFWESLIPIWGSARSAIDHFQNGRWGWGIFQTILAITDIFLVKSIVTAGGKLLVKGGLKYAPRLLAREAADPLMHNFPRIIDKEVIGYGTRTVKSSTYVEYTIRGTVSGRSGRVYTGVYEIGINPKTNEVVHRFFRPY